MNNKGMWHGNNSKTWSMYKTKKEQRRNKSKPRSTHRTSPYTCTEDCATPSLQTSQFFSLTSQLWEMQNMVEMLHNHISEANWECNAAQCHADHAIWVSWLLWNNPTTLCESLCMAGCLLCWWRMCHMVDGSDDDVFPDNDSPGTCHYMHVSPVQPGCASLSCYALSPHQRAVQPLPLHSFNSSIPEAPEVTVTPSHSQGE